MSKLKTISRRTSCWKCGASISGYGKYGLCRSCSQRQRLARRPTGGKIETTRASILAGIEENRKTYGIRPKCRRCEFDCKQIRVKKSRIISCPKVRGEKAAYA